MKSFVLVALIGLLLLAGCSSAPEPWTMSPWGYAAHQCEEYDRGLEQIGCMREALQQLQPGMYAGPANPVGAHR